MVEQEVKDELGKSDLEKRADELSVGRVGEPTANMGVSESPIEEARRLSKELKTQLNDIRTAKRELDDTLSAAMLSGKSFGNTQPKEISQDERDDIRARELVKNFLG